MMLSHPFAVERVHYLQQWAGSEEYQQIKKGNYQRSPASGAVDVTAQTNQNQEVENLRKKIEELQREINKIQKPD
jgi:hypothetical protein